MKVKIQMLILCTLMAGLKITGCKTMILEKPYSSLNKDENAAITCKNVEVSINSVPDPQLSHQVKDLLEFKLLKMNKQDSDKEYELYVNVNEKNYIQNFENRYSLFITVKINNEFNQLVYSNCYYASTKESFISSSCQAAEIETIISDIRSSLIKNEI